MKKIRFLCIGLILSLLSINTVHSQEAISIYHADNSSATSSILNNVQRIIFSGDNLSVKLSDNAAVYSLCDIEKITFGNAVAADITNPSVVALDVAVYTTSSGEIVVKSPVAIQSLMLFSIGGKILHTSTLEASLQTSVNVSALSTGTYLLRIETHQGSVVKKIIKK